MQCVESSNPELCSVPLSKLCAKLKGPIRKCHFSPQSQRSMLVESLKQAVSLAPGNGPTKYVLFDGVRPFGHMQGCYP